MRRKAGLDGVESGVVRADPKGCPGGGPVGPCAGGPAQGSPKDGAAGSGIRRPSGTQTKARCGLAAGSVQGGDRCNADEDTTAPRKQRHTARRILARLIEEHGAEELSYSTVRDYVRVRRAQIDVEAGRRVEVFVPQEHAPGAEAEVDFGELWVILAGVKTKCHMFTSGSRTRARRSTGSIHPGAGGVPGRPHRRLR